MADFMDFLFPPVKWLWKFFEKIMKDALTFSANTQFNRAAYDEDTSFIPVEIKVRPGRLQTRLKSIRAANCIICVDDEYTGECNGLGQNRHKPRESEPHDGRLDLVNRVAPARDDAKPCYPFVIWVRPKKEMDEITIGLRTDAWIQPMPYIIVLGESNV